METQKSRGKYWIYFTIWLAIIIFMLATPQYRQFFWLALPGVCTYFALGMDIM
ncbi:MAG: hypothetical protein KGO81_13310 [Bacteroidota bacterium]|nr:hypothetical protein [Bacteroidota bacterium]